MKIKYLCLATVPLSLLGATSAHADESYFGYVVGADTQPKGHGEVSLAVTRRTDKDSGFYHANDVLLDVEYGVTDRFSVGIELEGFHLAYKDAFAKTDDTTPGVFADDVYPTQFKGSALSRIGVNAKYQFQSPYTHNVGITLNTDLYYRWRYGRIDGGKTRQFSLEPNLIIQKNFLDDTLITALNLKVEIENRNFPNGDAENELKFEPSFGVTYRVAKGLFIGGETFYRTDNLNGNFNHGSVFLGPTLHYAAKKWYVTATFQKQVTGTPTYSYNTSAFFVDRGVNLEEETRNEARVKIGFNF